MRSCTDQPAVRTLARRADADLVIAEWVPSREHKWVPFGERPSHCDGVAGISAITLPSGTPMPFASLTMCASAITLDASNLYFVDPDGPVFQVGLATGAKPLMLGTANGGGPASIAVDATNVYWAGGGVWAASQIRSSMTARPGSAAA